MGLKTKAIEAAVAARAWPSASPRSASTGQERVFLDGNLC